MPDAKHELVVLEDSLLTSMAGNSAFVAEFPFLAPLARVLSAAAPRSSCGGCGRTSSAPPLTPYGAAKAAIAAMPVAKKVRLKELLNARQLRVTYSGGNGRQIKYTF